MSAGVDCSFLWSLGGLLRTLRQVRSMLYDGSLGGGTSTGGITSPPLSSGDRYLSCFAAGLEGGLGSLGGMGLESVTCYGRS